MEFSGRTETDRFPVAMAAGTHPFPFRTRQLSPPAPMVLGGHSPGRVGRRRIPSMMMPAPHRGGHRRVIVRTVQDRRHGTARSNRRGLEPAVERSRGSRRRSMISRPADDDAEVERLAAEGFTPETDRVGDRRRPACGAVLPAGRSRAAAEGAAAPRHRVVDWQTEIERLVGLGAVVKERFEAHVWMQDPEGNDFCVVDAHPHSQH